MALLDSTASSGLLSGGIAGLYSQFRALVRWHCWTLQPVRGSCQVALLDSTASSGLLSGGIAGLYSQFGALVRWHCWTLQPVRGSCQVALLDSTASSGLLSGGIAGLYSQFGALVRWHCWTLQPVRGSCQVALLDSTASSGLLSGGIAGLYSQFGALVRWHCWTLQPVRGYQKWWVLHNLHMAQFYEKTLKMVDLFNVPDCQREGRHCGLEKAEVKKSEEAVQRVLTAVRIFTNSFIVDKERICLASGAPVPTDIEMDVLWAKEYDNRLSK